METFINSKVSNENNFNLSLKTDNQIQKYKIFPRLPYTFCSSNFKNLNFAEKLLE